MSRIVCITGLFDVMSNGRKTGRKELTIDYGVNEDTLQCVVLPCVHPAEIGARMDHDLGEWVLDEQV